MECTFPFIVKGGIVPPERKAVGMVRIIMYCEVMQNRASRKRTISFRLEPKKVAALDRLARLQTRDRTFLLKEAVESYLEVQQWQIEHIQEGLRQAEAGMGTDHDKVRAKWQRRLR